MNPAHKKIEVPVYFDFAGDAACRINSEKVCTYLKEYTGVTPAHGSAICKKLGQHVFKNESGIVRFFRPHDKCPLHGDEDDLHN